MRNFEKTPHINAEKDDFAKTVLMPGDPLRSKFIAETFLEDAKLVNNVRGIQGYTGTYKGHRVSVMASGMGMPSMGIYSYELYNNYGVENIIRIGSAGSVNKDLNLKDIVISSGTYTNSNYDNMYEKYGVINPKSSEELVKIAEKIAKEKCCEYKVGNLYTTDTFYGGPSLEELEKLNVLALEMEAAALYINAEKLGKKALAICTISDSLITKEACSAEERQNSFTDMMELALEIVTRIDENV